MLTLITGTPGSGKTLFAVEKLLKMCDEFPERPIYSDITGLKVQGVLPPPDDYRDCPDGSIIFLDEVHLRKPYSRHQKTYDEMIESLTIHRKRDFDIILITQKPRFLNPDVKAVVNEHYHLHRPMNAKLAKVYLWRETAEYPSTSSARQDAENDYVWRYPTSLFDMYHSAVGHSSHNKLAIPAKIFSALWLVIMVVGATWYLFNSASSHNDDTIEQAQTVKQDKLSDDYKPSSISPVGDQTAQTVSTSAPLSSDHESTRPAFIVSSSTGDCYAKNSYGELLDISIEKCRLYSKHPNLLSGSRSSSFPVYSPPSTPTNVSYTTTVPTQQSQDTIM